MPNLVVLLEVLPLSLTSPPKYSKGYLKGLQSSTKGDYLSVNKQTLRGTWLQGHSGESQSLPGNAFREGGEAVCNIDSSEVLGACPNGEVRAFALPQHFFGRVFKFWRPPGMIRLFLSSNGYESLVSGTSDRARSL